MNLSFLRNIEAFYKSSKKSHKGLDEFQSIDAPFDSDDDEGDGCDDAFALAPPFGSTFGSKSSNPRLVRVS